MRNAGRKPRFSRNFACFRFPDAVNGKKVNSKIFPLLYSLTLSPTDSGCFSKIIPPFTVRRFLASFVISSFSFLHFSLNLLFYFSFSLLSLYFSLYLPILYLLSLTQIHIHVHTHAYTLSTSIQFSLQVYVLIFTIIICGYV